MSDDENCVPVPPLCPNCKRPLNYIIYNHNVRGIEWTSMTWEWDDGGSKGWAGGGDWQEETEGTDGSWLECGLCNHTLDLDDDAEWIECDIEALKALGAPDELVMEESL